MTAGTYIDDGGKVTREIVGVSVVIQGKSEGHVQCDLRGTNEFTVSPWLTVNHDLTTGSNCIQKRLRVVSKIGGDRNHLRKQRSTFPFRGRYLVDSSCSSNAKDVLPTGVNIDS